MLTQLKTDVLIKEAIQLAFFRLAEYLERQHLWVRLQAQNGQKQRTFFWNSSVYSCSEKLPRNWRSHTTRCTTSQNRANCLTRIERVVGGPVHNWEGQHPGVASSLLMLRLVFWRLLFNEAACWGLVRRLFLKLDPLIYLSSCSVVHRGHPLFLFWLETVCAVLWSCTQCCMRSSVSC